ncbi:LOG family protein [Patescibacteria group bacterium]|nr:LOG family protein [Patescibacteria group bacterium]MBU1683393.1 LOG family protein [Patescibacteria group bacterium]MBU1934832.1 LOG family protein [Patescibacteria group bacterium]
MDVRHFRVAIFGSARIKRNDPRYKLIHTLAKMIARDGIDVVTGGGYGLMEAANKGHREGQKRGGKVQSFGLNIKLPKEQKANKHLDIKKEFGRFSDRLDYFMHLSNAVVVAPGGIGTLLEFLYTWQLIQVGHICNIPIILLGKMWPDFIKWIEKWPLKKKLIDIEDMHPIFLADNCKEAIKIIRKAHKDFIDRGPDYCWNYKKYKID